MTFNALEDDELDSNWPSSALFVYAVLHHFRAEKCQLIMQPQQAMGHMRNHSEGCLSEKPGPGRERRGEENELTRKIGAWPRSISVSVTYLAQDSVTVSEDWTLVLDVCDHASTNESNAKEAVRALRREFKYAIILCNSSDTFISQPTSCKFLDMLEDLLTSSRTSPVVREHVMDVLAAAVKDAGFRGLLRRFKPWDKPEEGMLFDAADAMLNSPARWRAGLRLRLRHKQH
ncbi:hypothetical protein B0H17DRAFT_1190295 [Mycena rosella]|uniref:VHS domain-containing protein n=1 Tax=Mycena rosella TaxID=1033263 RepID=A0AAD7MCE2_MYCRO|nr:hypothetical protein B0H17DRAFT_1190295 [Mycena rosella]